VGTGGDISTVGSENSTKHQQIDKSSFPELFLLFKDEKLKKMKSTRSFFNPGP
jgi:hypothetical protein